MRDDTEMDVATLNADLARDLRLMLWAEHLGLLSEDDLFTFSRHLGHERQRASLDQRSRDLLQYLKETVDDSLDGLQLMIERAQDNLHRYKAKQPLLGHLLPLSDSRRSDTAGAEFPRRARLGRGT
jgi:HET-S-like prion-inhibition and propagation protein